MNSIGEVLAAGAIRPVYQPIVELATGLPVAYEALARGPHGSALERPDSLFAAARSSNRLRELDWACRTAAVRGALGGRLRPPMTLFINSEPETIGSRMSSAFAEWWARARLASLQIVFEVTERAVMERPAELLRATDLVRTFGWGVALDDVGTNPESMALLPFLKPDVIKLDMSLVHGTAVDVGEIVFAVNAEVERSGAVLLAEGLETEAHLEMARTLGATLGQGWLFGKPEALPDDPPRAGPAIRVTHHAEPEDREATPHSIIRKVVAPRRVEREHLLGASRLIEKRAGAMPHPPLMLATFQHARRFSGETKTVYEHLSDKLPFIALMAEGWPEETTGARRVALGTNDPLTREWNVGIISPFSAMLLSAREIEGGSSERYFDVSMTFDRDLAIAAADLLLRRLVTPEPDEVDTKEEVDFADAVAEIVAAADAEVELARPLLEVMSRITGLESTFLSRVHEDGRYDVVVSHNHGPLDVTEGYSMPWTETICHDALTSGKPSFADVQAELPMNRVGADFGFRTFVTCPVFIEDGRVIGTLCGASSEVAPLSPSQVELVRRFAELVGRHVASAH